MCTKDTAATDAVQLEAFEERMYDIWDSMVVSILSDAEATARIHRHLQAEMAAGRELVEFDLWIFPALYGRGSQQF